MFLGMTQAEFYKTLEMIAALAIYFGTFLVAAGLWSPSKTAK